MKRRVIALLLALMLAFTAGALAESGARAWTTAEVRYSFEHSMLPRYFYDDPQNMLNVFADSDIYALWERVATDNGADVAYAPGDYAARTYSSGGATLMQFDLPEPDATTLCYRIYLFYNPSSGKAGYYTVEYDEMMPGARFVCMWTAEREHVNYGALDALDRSAADYEAGLAEEAGIILSLAGEAAADSDQAEGESAAEVSAAGEAAEAAAAEVSAAEEAAGEAPAGEAALATIACPEQGFSILADPAYSWDYQEGTGITIYTERAGSIPYAIVYQGEDLIAEPFDYIMEQYTPYMRNRYGEDLVSFTEFESYTLGGREMPAAVYTYRLQGYLIDCIRAYDSSGERTVAYTAKYIQGQGEATLAALNTAAANFRPDAE